jgi:hypothetical protein
MSSSDPAKALLMQHFLKDLTIMLSGMAFHAAETHPATSEGDAFDFFSFCYLTGAGSAIQVRYCCLNLSLTFILRTFNSVFGLLVRNSSATALKSLRLTLSIYIL